jgi:aryl-alcohol dehydrogenase-like predicted oxidoreductase
MQYTNINGYRLSRITLGTVQLGMDYGIANQAGKPDRQQSMAILQAAVRGGINSFDTAFHYGESEKVLGEFFKARALVLPPVLITKFKMGPDHDLTASEVQKEISGYAEQSRRRLQMDKLPIYMLHNARDMTRCGNAVADALSHLKDQGIIGSAGVSVYTPEEVAEMLENELYEVIQLPMNLFDGRWISTGILKRLKAAGKIILVRSVFLQGLFFKDPATLQGKLRPAEKWLRQISALAEEEGMSVAQLAFSYIRDLEEVASLVVGAETPEQVTANLNLLAGPAVSAKTRAQILESFADIPKEIVNPALW